MAPVAPQSAKKSPGGQRKVISDFGFRISDLTSPSLRPPQEAHSRSGAVAEGLIARPCEAPYPAFLRHGEPGCARHVERFQHRRHTTSSLEGHLSLLPLGKPRRARPDVAFRGRAGTETGTGRTRTRTRALQPEELAGGDSAGLDELVEAVPLSPPRVADPRPNHMGRGPELTPA